MQTAHNGQFLINDAAAADPACQQAMASYLKQMKRERQQREWFAKWNATRQTGTYGTWHISDRD